MSRNEADVIVVGARCAGASLASFLARSGVRVLLLDRDALPSDQVLSTHTIHPPGIDVLDELGVLDAIREVTPPAEGIRLVKDGAGLDLRYAEGRLEYCPRRKRLDDLLQRAAVAAGAELRDRTRVVGLLEEDGRVAGVRAIADGEEREWRAPLVVGADGRRSTVAKLVGAEEYLAYDAPRGMYWSYWPAPDDWGRDPDLPPGMYVAYRGEHIRTVFPTDHGQLLVGSLPAAETAKTWRSDAHASLVENLAGDPVTARIVDGVEPAEPVRGTFRERYFFRAAAGPGWALVGDAGHHKEFVIGDGITEALLQARSLAPAIVEGTDAARTRWWRARDVEALPLYFFGQDEGAPGPVPTLQRIVFAKLAREPEIRARMARTMEHQASPYDTIPVRKILRWTLGAALRGRLRVIADFVHAGRRGAAVHREIRAREKLLAAAG